MSVSPSIVNLRKTPRQQRSAALVEAIYEAAARILETDGLAGLTTNRVAEVAGVSVGSLYQYFPSKEAILAGLVRRSRQELLEGILQAIERADGGPLERVADAVLHVAARSQFDRADLARTLEYVEPILPLDAETQQLKTQIADAVAALLAAYGVERPLVAAQDITAMVRGLIDAAGLRGERDIADVEARARRAVLGYLDRTIREPSR